MLRINSSISFDKTLYEQDISASKVHATMLSNQGIITKEELTAIFHELVEKVVCSVAEEVSERVIGQTQSFDAQLKI